MAESRKLPEGFDWRAVTPEDSPKTPMDLFDDPKVRALSAPDVTPGGPAFDFNRPLYDFSDGDEVKTGENFHLLTACQERPVALIFGSYT